MYNICITKGIKKMINVKKPVDIEMLDQVFPVVFNTNFTGRSDYGHIMVNGKPVTCIHYKYCQASPDSLARAEVALKNYFDNNGAYNNMPISKVSMFDLEDMRTKVDASIFQDRVIPFDLSMIDDVKTSVDGYCFEKTPHLVVECNLEGEEYKFAIWDHSMMKEVALRFNNRVGASGRSYKKFTRESTGFQNVFKDIH